LLSVCIALVLVLALPALATAECRWGSFDATRINYPDGPLTGNAHSTLRTIITANGGTIAASAPALTAAYLGGVEVFYTSLLSTATGILSAAEQTALQAWINAGGTLIVTGDIFPLPAYESFTSVYGVTGYTSISGVGNGTTTNTHPIITGVGTFNYNTNCTFNYGGDALLLGVDSANNTFMVVLEPGTGFPHAGRVLVLGDHNMFTNSSIGNADNTRLANNIAQWACHPVVAVEPATWGQVKSVFAR
jgi:hypothetical protein